MEVRLRIAGARRADCDRMERSQSASSSRMRTVVRFVARKLWMGEWGDWRFGRVEELTT